MRVSGVQRASGNVYRGGCGGCLRVSGVQGCKRECALGVGCHGGVTVRVSGVQRAGVIVVVIVVQRGVGMMGAVRGRPGGQRLADA